MVNFRFVVEIISYKTFLLMTIYDITFRLRISVDKTDIPTKQTSL
jgi:hypothetical protein